MIDRTFLSRPIRTLDDAKRWIEELHAADMSFHFEDDPREIEIGLSGVALFSDEEAVQVRRRQVELYALDWPKEFECPIGYLIHLGETDSGT